ncbi:MYND-type zinc finger-containing chromatin reader ZMYND8 [Trichinella pseudospiralis]
MRSLTVLISLRGSESGRKMYNETCDLLLLSLYLLLLCLYLLLLYRHLLLRQLHHLAAKTLKLQNNAAEVMLLFFGSHEYATVPMENCYLLSLEPP